VRSVLAQSEESMDLIWIDNASQDGTGARLRKEFPRLPKPTVNARNEGFCAPHNAAIEVCRTKYYLALNQDVVLEPDYICELCDWMDRDEGLALTSGLILMKTTPGSSAGAPPRVYSAGMVFPRVRFAFELGMGGPVRKEYESRRDVPGVDGAAMMLRVEACRAASLPPEDVFPEIFFAYSEEVDLAMRLARLGLRCGVDGAARARHAGQGSGGLARPEIRARFFLNHWLLTLRHDRWRDILMELPYIIRGELQYWLPLYFRHPLATLRAKLMFPWRIAAARRFRRGFQKAHGPTDNRLRDYKRRSLAALRESKRIG
jgi:GT2 family glycosyltransferase